MFGWLGGAAAAINPVAAIGTLGQMGGSVLDYMGQKSANQTNMDLMRETNAFNAAEAAKAREFSGNQADKQMRFQQDMSNTAFQRSRADMEAAGINPMLMASQGGASSPAGASGSAPAASGTSTRVENASGKLGQGLSNLAPSALAVAQQTKQLESTDAQIQATKAQATAALAQAANSQASAKATETQMPEYQARARSAHERSEADIEEAQARRVRAQYDKDYADIDKAISTISNAMAIPSSAVNLRRLWEGGKSNQQRNHEFLEKQGRKGARVR